MKEWIITKVAGPLGMVVRPIIASLIGVIIGLLYEQAWIAVYKVAWLKFLVERVIAGIPPDVLASLTPSAIGTATALALWIFASDWVIQKLRGGIKEIQVNYNANPNTGTVRADGIAIKGGETATAISRLAYEAIYPQDTDTRPSLGVPEIRRPLPK